MKKPGLDPLIGEWRGHGVADFPTIERVEYREELRVDWDAEREVLCYEQRVMLSDGKPSHREVGFVREAASGELELWNAQDNGRTEVMHGASTWDEGTQELTLDLRSVAFGNDARMLESRRLLRVDADRMSYELLMATTTTSAPEVFLHLTCELLRLAKV